jgi:hypothetical protein
MTTMCRDIFGEKRKESDNSSNSAATVSVALLTGVVGVMIMIMALRRTLSGIQNKEIEFSRIPDMPIT